MSRLPVVSGRDCRRALEGAGLVLRMQEGSHMILRRNYPYPQVAVPNHKVLDRGTLPAILCAAEMTSEKFEGLL